MKFEVGKYYRTYGGWKAMIIWKCYKQDIFGEEYQYYLVVHKPEGENESNVVSHKYDGRAVSILAVNEPPLYGIHHPADLKEEWK